MIRSPIFSVAYTLVYLLTFGLGFYPKSSRNTRQQKWKNRDSKFDQTLSMRTLLIDNFDSYTYNIWQLLSEVNGEEPIVVYNNAFNYDWEELLRSVPAFDNIVLSPGPGSPDVHADFGLCKNAILQSNLPVLGVCLGHQGIAHHFGGVVNRAKTPMHGRLSTIKHINEGLFYNIPQDSKVVRYHSLIVEPDMPLELQATAWTNDGIVMGLKHISKPIHGVQFHPESIATECGRQIFTNFKHLTEKHHSDTKLASNLKESSQNVHHGSKTNFLSQDQSKTTETASTENKNQVEGQIRVNNNDRQIRNVFIAKKQFSKEVNVKEIFTELYGESSASFWLDSSSAGKRCIEYLIFVYIYI
jgi:anthranilate synthase/aminodeoxychorismate synthase-like glutamine amidotransferase